MASGIREKFYGVQGVLATGWFAYLAWRWRGEAFGDDGQMNPEMGPVVIFLCFIVGCAIFGLVARLIRGAARRSGERAIQAVDDEPLSDFDADAALARYMANRPADLPPPAAPAAADEPPAPARASFGRKGTFG